MRNGGEVLLLGLPEIIIIALCLSMDAFAVSITLGLSLKNPKPIDFFIPGIYFGVFQALMPLIGYTMGNLFSGSIQHLDHWVAFLLLALIGLKMIKDSFSEEKEGHHEYQFVFIKMLILAIATSIDALAVGITFAFFRINILAAIIITGFTTFCISAAGIKAGIIFGTKLRSKAEFAGGAVLIILGLKILIEHLLFHK